MNTHSVPLPSRESVTHLQITSLLSALSTVSASIYHLTPNQDNPGGSLDGGSRMAAENTLVNICSRLDSILADSERWGIKTLEALEKKCDEVYTAHLDLMAQQKIAVQAMQAPHKSHTPTLLRLDDGRWTAILGDIRSPSVIVGVGQSPAEAIADFDEIFKGRKSSVTIETEPTNEKHMDPGTVESVDKTSKRRKKQRRSGGDNGKN